jgi:RNA polymerase sigma factor (sigma-70 family)
MSSGNSKETEFRVLMDSFAPFIKVLLYRYQLHKYGLDPEDVIQDVRMKIWKLVCSEKKIGNYSSYIKKIVSSSVIDQLRKFRRDKGVYNHALQIHIAEFGHHYSKDSAQNIQPEISVGRAVESLINTRRQVVKLYLMNLTIKEIANYLNWSEDKTRNLLYRGLSDLKKVLKSVSFQNENR